MAGAAARRRSRPERRRRRGLAGRVDSAFRLQLDHVARAVGRVHERELLAELHRRGRLARCRYEPPTIADLDRLAVLARSRRAGRCSRWRGTSPSARPARRPRWSRSERRRLGRRRQPASAWAWASQDGRSRRRRARLDGRGGHLGAGGAAEDWAGVRRRRAAGRLPSRSGRAAIAAGAAGAAWSRGSRERQLLDERILALEEAERDQLARVAHDHDAVRVMECAGGAQGAMPTGRLEVVVPTAAMARAPCPPSNFGSSKPRTASRTTEPTAMNIFWRLTRFSASADAAEVLMLRRPSAPAGAAGIGCEPSIAGGVGAVGCRWEPGRRSVAEVVGGDGQRRLDLRERAAPLVEGDRVDREETAGGVQDAVVDARRGCAGGRGSRTGRRSGPRRRGRCRSAGTRRAGPGRAA